MKENHSKFTKILALLILTVFALCLLLVLLTGASIYQKLVDNSEINHNSRTAFRYLSTRVRQAETVQFEDFHGCDALLLEETVADETYITRIYCWDGWLRELYSAPGTTLIPADGEPVLEADSLSCALDNNLLKLVLDQNSIYLHLPTLKEVVP